MHTLCETAQSVADGLMESHRAVASHTARFLIQLREFDLHRAYRQPRKGGDTSRSTAEWLRKRCGVAEDATRQHLRVAYALLNLPAIEQAFEEGDLSYRKVCAASQCAMASTEAALLEALRTMTDQQAEECCKRLKLDQRKESDGAGGTTPRLEPAQQPAILAPNA